MQNSFRGITVPLPAIMLSVRNNKYPPWMIKKTIPYCLLVFKIDLLVSIAATVITSTLSPKGITFESMSYIFMLSYFSGGFLLGIFFFEIARKQEYYFYYNLGISKLRLVLISYLFNLVIILPFLIISAYARYI